MAEKKNIYETEVMALPPLRMVLGEIPSPDPDWRRGSGRKLPRLGREMEGTVKRIIAHLKNKDRL